MTEHRGKDRPSTWEPGPALAANVITTLTTLSRRWYKAMALALGDTEAAREYMHDFAYALRNVDPRVFGNLGREYLSGHDFPPGPNELRVEAEKLQARDFPTKTDPITAPEIVTGVNHARAHEISRQFREKLGSYQLAMAGWHYLEAAATDPASLERVRNGEATPEEVTSAIMSVQRRYGAAGGSS